MRLEEPRDLYRIGDTDLRLAADQFEWELKDRLRFAEEIIDGGPTIGIREKDEAYGQRDAYSRMLDRGRFLGLFAKENNF